MANSLHNIGWRIELPTRNHPDRNMQILRRVAWWKMTYKKAGEPWGLSRERTRQICLAALRKIDREAYSRSNKYQPKPEPDVPPAPPERNAENGFRLGSRASEIYRKRLQAVINQM